MQLRCRQQHPDATPSIRAIYRRFAHRSSAWTTVPCLCADHFGGLTVTLWRIVSSALYTPTSDQSRQKIQENQKRNQNAFTGLISYHKWKSPDACDQIILSCDCA